MLVVASIVLLGGCAPSTPDAVPVVRAHSGDEHDKRPLLSDTVVETALDGTGPGCSAAVAVNGEVRWAHAKGIADLATGAPITTDTRFDIASVTKQFTATAILLLQREGKLSLSEPVGTYLDGLPAWGDTITLEQLMHHTSHLRDYWMRLEADGYTFGDHVPYAEVVGAIARVRTLEPGTGYLYSNSNYVLLAEVVRQVSGQALPDYLASQVFGPLGLNMELTPNLRAPDVALSYDDNNQLQLSGWEIVGPSEIYATATELARWGDQYRESTIIQDDFETGAVDNGEGGRYGAGINIHESGALRHDGRIGGHITTFRVSPDRETTVVVTCNGHLVPRTAIADDLWELWVD